MSIEKIKKYAAPALSGVLLTLCQALPWQLNLGFLAWVALVPLAAVLRDKTQGERFLIGTIAGGVHFLTSLYWIAGTLHTYGNLNIPGSVFVALLLVALETSYVVLFALLAGLVLDRAPKSPMSILLPFLWTAVEYLRMVTPFGGFPWILIGYSQGGYALVVQSADLGGVWIITFLIALVNGAIADVMDWRADPEKFPFPKGAVTAAVLLMVANLVYGAYRIRDVRLRNDKARPLIAAALQGDIRQDMKWEDSTAEMILMRYVELHRQAIEKGARFVVWPEAATPFAFERDFNGMILARQLANSGTYTLLGSADYTVENEKRRYSNSAYFVGPSGIEGKYSKMHLVPFGEYIPFVKYLAFIDKIVKGAAGNFNAGKNIEVFKLPEGTVSVIICYEAIFGSEVRRFRKAGAELLVNITNDAWFGDTSAPRQHLAMAAFRCVENHCWMVRSANTGISAIIDPLGKIRASTKIFTKTLLVEEVKLMPGVTPYARWGDIFLYAVLAACVAGLGWVFIAKRKRNRE